MWMRLACTLATLAASALPAVAQSAADLPAFELATVRPSGPESGPMSIQLLPGGRLITSNTPLRMLVAWAFRLDDGRLFGVPKGAEARFDVVAQAPAGELNGGALYQMTQRLLADRFKLAAHRETRPLTAYTLVVDDGGFKLKTRPFEPAGSNPFRISTAGVLSGTGVTGEMLATVLSSQLGRPVTNKTGIAGVFDFTLQWAPDERAAPDVNRPSLSTAIREQLGLRLVAQTMQVEVVVIDRLETTPTEN